MHMFGESGNNVGDFALIFRKNSGETTKNPRSIYSGTQQAILPCLFHSSHAFSRCADNLVEQLKDSRIQRAIGVIYRRDTERQSHYFGAKYD